MVSQLPKYIDPLYLADKRAELKGELLISNLDRMADILYDNTGTLFIELIFSRQGRLASIEGFIEGELELRCQNCLQVLKFSVDPRFKLGIVGNIEQADKLPEEYEPLLVTEDQKILLKDLVEDELLLILPIFPKHQHTCFATEFLIDKNQVPLNKNQNSNIENPFSILAKIKKTGDS